MYILFSGLTLRGGGNVLIPCYPTGVVYDLFECLSVKMQELGVSNCPMFFVSPVADTSLAYSNILAEWLSSAKQNKVGVVCGCLHVYYWHDGNLIVRILGVCSRWTIPPCTASKEFKVKAL